MGSVRLLVDLCSYQSSATCVRTVSGVSAMRVLNVLCKYRVSALCKFVALTSPSCLLTFSVISHVGSVAMITLFMFGGIC